MKTQLIQFLVSLFTLSEPRAKLLNNAYEKESSMSRTTWVVPDSEGDLYTYHFIEDGSLRYV